jgi:hypothetical protein
MHIFFVSTTLNQPNKMLQENIYQKKKRKEEKKKR